SRSRAHLPPHSFPTRRSSDLLPEKQKPKKVKLMRGCHLREVNSHRTWSKMTCGTHKTHTKFSLVKISPYTTRSLRCAPNSSPMRSEEHTSELQSRFDLVCRLL